MSKLAALRTGLRSSRGAPPASRLLPPQRAQRQTAATAPQQALSALEQGPARAVSDLTLHRASGRTSESTIRAVDNDSTFTATAARDDRCIACSTTAKPPVPNGSLVSEHASECIGAKTHRWLRRAHTRRLCCSSKRRRRRRCAVLPELLGPMARRWTHPRRSVLLLRSRRASAPAPEADEPQPVAMTWWPPTVRVCTAKAEPRSTLLPAMSTPNEATRALRRQAALEGS